MVPLCKRFISIILVLILLVGLVVALPPSPAAADGSDWSAMTSGTANNLNDVWGSSDIDVFAVGDGGTILHYDGSAWSAMTSGTTNNLNGVWGSSGSDVYAVGDGGTILHYGSSGSAWSAMTSGTARTLNGVWGSSDIDVFAVGGVTLGRIWHYDGSAWSPMTSTLTGLNGVWGTSAFDVFAVGDGGISLHYVGDWRSMSNGTANDLNGVWGSSGSDIFAVGESGTIRHYGGSTWSSMSSGSASYLYGVWGSSDRDVFAVGESGTILHYSSNAINDAPVVSDIPDQTIDEGGSFTTIVLDNYVNDPDNADNELTWTYSGNTELIVLIDINRVATITTPAPSWYGSEIITFRATDPGMLWDEDAATFTVNPAAPPGPVTIDIDIKPGSDPNSINPFSKGRIPVAILADGSFDVTSVNPTTVRFGQTGYEASPVHYALDDVDDDGDMDMIFHFRTQETGLEAEDTEATLTGQTTDGIEITGTDSVRIVPPEGKGKANKGSKPEKGGGQDNGNGNPNPGQGNNQGGGNDNPNSGQGNNQGGGNGNSNPGQGKGKK